jgi:hypothetical protein
MSPEPTDRSIPFDPSAGTGPDGILLPPREGGEVVALLVDAAVRGDLWGERAAAALAREWAARGRSVILVDADVETPSLHEYLEVPNLEGLSDVLLYGASLERVMVEPPREPFRLVTSGTVVADPAALRGSDRWDAFLDRVRSRDEVALLFVPTGGGGASLLAGRGDRLLRLARPGTTSPEGLPSGVLLHPVGAAPEPDSMAAASDSTPLPVSASTTGHAPAPPAGGTGADAPAAAGGDGSPATTTPSPVRTSPARSGPRPRSGGGRQKFLLIAFLLLLVLILLGAWLGLVDIPGFPTSS